jgi:hypothetical protein
MLHNKVVEKIKTHIFCSVTFFKKHAVYGIMWKNTVQPDRPQMTTWHMSIACWIPKVTNTHPKYVYLLLFPLQQWLHKCTTMSCYMYIPCLVSYKYKELNKLN